MDKIILKITEEHTEDLNFKIQYIALASVAQFSGALSRRLKDHGFDSQSGHTPRLQV